jgi:hypothetical protein
VRVVVCIWLMMWWLIITCFRDVIASLRFLIAQDCSDDLSWLLDVMDADLRGWCLIAGTMADRMALSCRDKTTYSLPHCPSTCNDNETIDKTSKKPLTKPIMSG